MENTNENEVVVTEPAPAVETKVEKVITFNETLKEAWDIFKYFFKEHVLYAILFLVLLVIPIINLLTMPLIILVVGRKMNGEEDPFKGVFKIYFSKFWRMIALGFVFFGFLFWKILPWLAGSAVAMLLVMIFILKFPLLVQIIFSTIAVILGVISAVIMIKYSYGWMFSTQTFYFEDKKNKGALDRSWELTLGNKKNVFFYVLALGLLTGIYSLVVFLIFNVIFRLNPNNVFQSSFTSIFSSSPVTLLMFTFLTALYFKIKNNFGNFKLKVGKSMKATVISLIILIPMISILAAITLVSLQKAREKAQNNVMMLNQFPQDFSASQTR